MPDILPKLIDWASYISRSCNNLVASLETRVAVIVDELKYFFDKGRRDTQALMADNSVNIVDQVSISQRSL